ncbi:MAG: alpha-L-fucosidase [Armatimonadetes bacterium]|nr:alpha-L-fucosidase [Armatimonadota bacterium]
MHVGRMVWLAAALAATGSGALAQGPSADPYAGETKVQRDLRMKWWREARFGMFIHWGVYSVPAGVYHGKPVGSIGEWIMNTAKIPVAEYRGFAREFNPVKYDADRWVSLAKRAGMKYIIITSKHHDGFAMFDTQASDWSIAKASPFGRDPLKELAAACRKHGLKLGFYYSQAQDWTNPGGAAIGGQWDPAQKGDMTEYIRRVAAPQVRELLTNYGKIAVFWWDTPADMTRERADMLAPLLRLQPGIIHNNRLGIYPGDSETPEQFVPATGYPGRDWETCMTMNDTWGFKSTDHEWKSPETLIRTLVDIASKGGNFLLNVGPTSLGEIPQPSVERLERVGQWMKVNSQAIYGAQASPFKRLSWGRCTVRPDKGGATLYLHVFDWPKDGRLLAPGLTSAVRDARLLAGRGTVKARNTAEGVELEVPTLPADPICTTIALRVAGPVQVENAVIGQAADGSVRLPAIDATCHGSQIRYESGSDRDNIGFWLDPSEWVEWRFRLTTPGRYRLSAEIAATGSGTFTVSVGGKDVEAVAPETGDYGRFQDGVLGEVQVDQPGIVTVTVKAKAERWSPINLKALRLVPVR